MSDSNPSERGHLFLAWDRGYVAEFQQIPVDDVPFFATFWPADSLEKRTAELVSGNYRRCPDHWCPSSGYNVLQGVQQFVNALFHTRNNPDLQRALWIEAALHELRKSLPESWRGDGFRLVQEASKGIRDFLRARDIEPGYRYNAATLPAFSDFELFAVPGNLYDLGRVIHVHACAVMGQYRLVYGGRLDENVLWFPEQDAPK